MTLKQNSVNKGLLLFPTLISQVFSVKIISKQLLHLEFTLELRLEITCKTMQMSSKSYVVN